MAGINRTELFIRANSIAQSVTRFKLGAELEGEISNQNIPQVQIYSSLDQFEIYFPQLLLYRYFHPPR